MIKVFISSAYSADNESDILKNVLNQKMIAEELYSYGFLPFTPLLYHYHDQNFPHDYEFWLDVDKAWLETCDCVLRDGSHSVGADREVDHASAKGIPVFKSMRGLLWYYGKISDDEFEDHGGDDEEYDLVSLIDLSGQYDKEENIDHE